jgi:decaprenylphospho-beta-D-ribofuranose 2-oxidase
VLSTLASETVEFVSFDGGVTETCERRRPDRYRSIETALSDNGSAIARGGGYSYSAASFGGGASVLDLTRFDRILGFDRDAKRVELQAGTTLGDLLSVTGPRNLVLGVQPGYPRITVGGCIAANVHGKNPWLEGTFADQVESLVLYHPRYGTREIDRSSDLDLFELTCGGFGLIGAILSATLRLKTIAGWAARVERVEIANLAEGLRAVLSMTDGSAFAYTWHDGVTRHSTFGRGFVYRGTLVEGAPFPKSIARYRAIDASSRAAFPLPLLSGATAGLLTRFFWTTERLKPATVTMPLFDAMFPFASRKEYFLLFGRRGLAEAQVIVPEDQAEGFLAELERKLRRERPPSVMISMKRFRGTQRLLRFEGDGICLTLDFARDDAVARFLAAFDEMCVDAGALPNVIKDSRISRDTVRRCYPGYEEFRERLHAYDPERLFRSELSQRLGI